MFVAHPPDVMEVFPVSRERRERAEIKQLAARRVGAVWTCLGILCPDLPLVERKALAERVLDLTRGECPVAAKRIEISPAQVQELVWRNSQCANRYCSMVLFSREIAEELNEFFQPEE
jgi:hypothetical protein